MRAVFPAARTLSEPVKGRFEHGAIANGLETAEGLERKSQNALDVLLGERMERNRNHQGLVEPKFRADERERLLAVDGLDLAAVDVVAQRLKVLSERAVLFGVGAIEAR